MKYECDRFPIILHARSKINQFYSILDHQPQLKYLAEKLFYIKLIFKFNFTFIGLFIRISFIDSHMMLDRFCPKKIICGFLLFIHHFLNKTHHM